jgi:hypothetical protein
MLRSQTAKPVGMLNWRTLSSIGSTPSREVAHNLSVPTRLCSDSGDDEIEHAVGPIRVGRMFIHQGDSVDESYHVENMDIRSDLFCGLGAEQEDFSRLVHSFVRIIDARSRNVLGSHDGCSHAPPSSREVHLETKPANQGVERNRSAGEFFSVRPQFIGLIQEHGFKEILTRGEVTVQRSDRDPSRPGNVLQDNVSAALRDRDSRRLQQAGVVALGISSHWAVGWCWLVHFMLLLSPRDIGP